MRVPTDDVTLRRNPLSSPHTHVPSFPTCYLMLARCASTRVRSTLPRHRSRCGCARRKRRRPVRCAPPQRGASIVTMGAPWPTSRGRITASAFSSASASGFAAIVPAVAVSSPNACPRWPLLGPAHPAAGPPLGRPRRGPGGYSRGAAWPPVGPGGKPEHPPAPAPEAVAARCPRPGCSG